MDEEPKRVLLPIEIKRRELAGKILLSLVLAKNNYTVFTGSKDILKLIHELRPHIHFELSAVDRESKRSRLRQLNECNVTTIVLDTEGSATGDVGDFEPRVSNKMLSHTDYYCAWGSKAANIASDMNQTDAEIRITGNPRFDLLQEPYQQVYRSTAKNIREKYGRIILFNTNFSVNHIDIEHNKEHSLVDPTETYKKQTRLLGNFIAAAGKVAEEFNNRNIIIRPHPSEDPSLYDRVFEPYNNIYVEKEGEVRPWILASDAVIHNSCTTGITSALLGTHVFAYMPDGIQITSAANDVSIKCRSVNKLIRGLEEYINSTENYTLNDTQISKLRPHIDNLDYISSLKLVELIDSIEHGKPHSFNEYFSPSVKDRIRKGLIRTTGPATFEKLYYKRLKGGWGTEYKFSETKAEEISSLIDSFPQSIVPKSLTIKPIPGVLYGFQIAKEKNELF